MSRNNQLNPLAATLGAALFAGTVGSAHALQNVETDVNPFASAELSGGFIQLADAHEGKCGEGKCGGEEAHKDHEGKCGEGKCGEEKAEEGKCGEEKAEEGKCGEGKCGGEH